MSQDFIPFGRGSVSPAAPPDAFRLKTSPPPPPAAPPPPAPAANPPPREPQLSVERDGDRITLIRIQCSCGQTHEVTCLYT